ncbi:transcriptional regulator NrdR [Defluviitalea saccharophila]|uniref:Transcriptional repressor NrdR n=1 Tax=Defluviitalea saccharophila TaxID=879970 RepID=A0ABZ2Y6H3_9FIRM|nr:transcriptional repressor NrdR [Candidatus Epulonipiscium sp.]
MRCPFCNCEDTKVIDSRPSEENNSIRRRRQCENCEKRFTTYEKVETIPVMVIKRDGTREVFDRNKILNGIVKSCNKRAIPLQQMESIVDDIENMLLNTLQKEVNSTQIGELVMKKLKEIDEVAYVRFASVYRQFKDINTFMEELTKLLQEKK